MEHEIVRAFQTVRAEESLKADTLERVLEAAARRRRRRRLGALAAACCCLALVVLGAVYRTPTSVISIDVNPSLELTVNRFDRVIAVSGYQEDGEALAASLRLLHLSYAQAVDRVVESPAVAACLERGEWLSISVVELDADQGAEILRYISACTAGTENASCRAVDQASVACAHDLGLSYGKYQTYVEIQAAGGSLTAQEAGEMTMGQLRALLAELEGGPAAGNGQGAGGGQSADSQGSASGQGGIPQTGQNGGHHGQDHHGG